MHHLWRLFPSNMSLVPESGLFWIGPCESEVELISTEGPSIYMIMRAPAGQYM